MTAHLVHAAAWLIVLAGTHLYYRPILRRHAAVWATRRARSARRTLAALRRGITLHPRQPHHAGRTRR